MTNTITPMPYCENPITIPSFEAPGKIYGLTHPDVVKLEKPWQGYTYWMAVTPNQTGNSQFENPCLAASNDGLQWEVPKGIQNPLTGIAEEPLPFHNCDTDLMYNEKEDVLQVYYVWSKDEPVYGEEGFHPSEVRMIKVAKDGEGFQVDPPVAVATSTYRYDLLSPAIVKGPDGTYRMWSVNTRDQGWNNQCNHVDLRLSEDGLSWGEPQSLENSFSQNGYQVWHLDVRYIPEKEEYWTFFSAYKNGGGSDHTDLFFAKSKDGITWETYEKPVLAMREDGWDNDFIYRSTFVYEAEEDLIRLWYSAGQSAGWQIGYTENTYTEMMTSLKKV